jgi:hypothetical protein
MGRGWIGRLTRRVVAIHVPLIVRRESGQVELTRSTPASTV